MNVTESMLGAKMLEVEVLQCAREECVPNKKVWYRAEEERNYYALHYVCHGKGKLVYKNKEYILKEGDMFLVAPKSEMVYYSMDNWQYYWVNVRGSRVYDLLKEVGLGEWMILKGAKNEDIAEAFYSLVDAGNFQDSLSAMGWFYILLSRIKNAERRKNDGKRMAERYVDAVIQYLLYNFYFPDVNLTTIANNLAISKNYLCKIFKEKTGKSPISYLIDIRLEDACKRLLENEDPIAAVGRTVGYKDALHFSKEFKKKYNMSPSQYRKLHSHLSYK